MNGRVLGAALLLALVGLAGGYAVAQLRGAEPATFATAAPVPAVSPSFPTDPPVEVLPDPGTDPLGTGLPLHDERLGQRPFQVAMPVPDGWSRTNPVTGEWRWYATPASPLNTYFVRMRLVGNTYAPVASALQARLDALASASGVDDFELESQTDDTFIATYVSGNYRRLAVERFVSLDGSGNATAGLAVIGRESDRAGLVDLMEQITAGISLADR